MFDLNPVHDLNPKLSSLIRVLADAKWHSGEALGAELGISRAAVSKQLKQLVDVGLHLESTQGRGYRLVESLDLLDRAVIESMLPVTVFTQLRILPIANVIDSTNSMLMRRLREGERVHADVCLAEQQNAGRGRRGRQWHSPFAKNMYMSVAWHFESGVSALEGLSLAVGVAICRALESLGVHDAKLKWPNDILINKNKLGGVLIELGGDAVSDCVAIIGVGLNVHMDDDGERIDQPWVSLSEQGYKVGRNALAVAMIEELIRLLSSYESQGFHSYRAQWESLNAFAGDEVQLRSTDVFHRGEMLGVDDGGGLRLRVNGEEQTFIGGELSLRGAS